MANEHAVPEEESGKVHGDKLDGVLNASADKGVSPSGSGGAMASHFAQPVDGEDGGGGLEKGPSDGKTMP